jgi:hypothetical protein
MKRDATATYRGFDDFYGYYLACNADYWYHTVANGAAACTTDHVYNASVQDWSDNVGTRLSPGDRVARNGTYNQELLTARAEAIIAAHDASAPLYMYLAYQNVHEGCARPDKLGMQAPLASVALYNTTKLDTCAFNRAQRCGTRCARHCDPNDPNTKPYARRATRNQQTSSWAR